MFMASIFLILVAPTPGFVVTSQVYSDDTRAIAVRLEEQNVKAEKFERISEKRYLVLSFICFYIGLKQKR